MKPTSPEVDAARRGAIAGALAGAAIPSEVDGAAAETEAVLGGTAFVLRGDQRVVAVGGAQAVDFLHRMLSQDVKGIPAGGVRPACFLTAQGKVVADLLVWNHGPGRMLVISRAAAERGLPLLERYVIADDVTLTDPVPAYVPALLLGSAASVPYALGALGVVADEAAFGTTTAWHLLLPADRLTEVVAALLAHGVEPALCGRAAFDLARVGAGAPLYGVELDDRVLPNEAGLSTSAVAWTKGCYLGQEPVVMAKHRGHPPTQLCRLRIDREFLLPPDAPLHRAGAVVGRVTTAVRVGRPGLTALGFVRHGLATIGGELALEGGERVTVERVFE